MSQDEAKKSGQSAVADVDASNEAAEAAAASKAAKSAEKAAAASAKAKATGAKAASASAASASAKAAEQPNPFKTIQRGEDGKYHWYYELNMYTNPVIVFVLWKIFFISFFAVFIFITLITVGDSWYGFGDFLDSLKVFLLLWLFMCALTLVVYWVYAAVVCGGKYCVLFEMDDECVVHRQLKKQFKKAQALNLLGVALGAAAKNPTVMGSNLLAATKSESSSYFPVVKSVKPRRLFHTIKVNELLEKNQVYVPDEDFDAVYQYIVDHCPNVRK